MDELMRKTRGPIPHHKPASSKSRPPSRSGSVARDTAGKSRRYVYVAIAVRIVRSNPDPFIIHQAQ